MIAISACQNSQLICLFTSCGTRSVTRDKRWVCFTSFVLGCARILERTCWRHFEATAPGHLSVHVGDSSRRSEEIALNKSDLRPSVSSSSPLSSSSSSPLLLLLLVSSSSSSSSSSSLLVVVVVVVVSLSL